jgi:hypothetical protein
MQQCRHCPNEELLRKSYQPEFSRRKYIVEESERYVKIGRKTRPVGGSLYFDHDILPQETLQRGRQACTVGHEEVRRQ